MSLKNYTQHTHFMKNMGFNDKKLRRLRRFRFFGRAKVYLMVRWPMLVRDFF